MRLQGERGAGGVLQGGGELGVGGADFLEAVVDDFVGEFGAVAVAAEVAEVDVAEVGVHDLFGDVRGGVVGEMAVAAEDALLDAPRALGVVLEQFEVVVGFEDKGVGGADAFEDELGGVPQVGQEADVSGRRMEKKSNRIVGVVRHAEGVHGQVADLEGGAGGEEAEVQARGGLGLDDFLGEAVAVDGNLVLGAEDGEALDVVAVLVGDEDAGEGFRGAVEGEEALANLASAEAGINEDAGVVGFEIGAVAGGTAAEDGELDGHGKDGRERVGVGQRFFPPRGARRCIAGWSATEEMG